MNKALFLDLDGTVRECTVEGQPCPNNPKEQRLLPGVLEKMKEYKDAGYYIIGVTNQGGIGLGYMTEDQCKDVLKELEFMCENLFDQIRYAPAKPRENDYCTKPNPGMIYESALRFYLNLKESVMVGDRESDRGCAANAGIEKFYWAHEFFDWSEL